MYKIYVDNKKIKVTDNPCEVIGSLDYLIYERVQEHKILVIRYIEELDMDQVELLYTPNSKQKKYTQYRTELIKRFVESNSGRSRKR